MIRRLQRTARRGIGPRAWLVYGLLVLATVALGALGYVAYHDGRGEYGPLDYLYFSLQLFGFEDRGVRPPLPVGLEIARLAAPTLAAIGIAGAVRELMRTLRGREWAVRRMNDHVIVCGLGRRGSFLARTLAEGGYDVVAIDPRDHPYEADVCLEAGVTIIQGDASQPAVLERAGIERAAHLVALCRPVAVNAAVCQAAHEVLCRHPGRRLHASIDMHDHDLRQLVEGALSSSPHLDLDLRSVFDKAATTMIEIGGGLALERHAAGRALMVVGLGKLGKALVVAAAHQWRAAGRDERLRVRVVDRDAPQQLKRLCFESPEVAELCDVTWWDGNVSSVEFALGEYLDGDAGAPAAIYVCIDEERLAVTTAKLLADRFADAGVPIVARVREEDRGIARLLPDAVTPFGLDSRSCTPEQFLGVPRLH